MAYCNYAAHAAKGLAQELSTKEYHPKDIESMNWMISSLKASHKFMLPHGGLIMNDDLKGLSIDDFKLPYPQIIIEFSLDVVAHNFVDLTMSTEKTTAILTETTVGEYMKHIYSEESIKGADEEVLNTKGIMLQVITCVKEAEGEPLEWWLPLPAAVFMYWCPKPEAPELAEMTQIIIPSTPTMYSMLMKQFPDQEKFEDYIRRMSSNEIKGMLELMEVLSCSNVKIDTVSQVAPSVNLKRERKGKLPLYDYHILSVEKPAVLGKSEPQGGTHASPRQHLRRGHIRKYSNGRKIWVNACLVGDASKGFVDKDYAIKGARHG